MNRVMVLLVMVAWLLGGCNGLATNDQRPIGGGSPVTQWGATCATCGAGVRGDYFFNSAEKAVGPGQGW
jgi:hypothetical protein